MRGGDTRQPQGPGMHGRRVVVWELRLLQQLVTASGPCLPPATVLCYRRRRRPGRSCPAAPPPPATASPADTAANANMCAPCRSMSAQETEEADALAGGGVSVRDIKARLRQV